VTGIPLVLGKVAAARRDTTGQEVPDNSIFQRIRILETPYALQLLLVSCLLHESSTWLAGNPPQAGNVYFLDLADRRCHAFPAQHPAGLSADCFEDRLKSPRELDN